MKNIFYGMENKNRMRWLSDDYRFETEKSGQKEKIILSYDQLIRRKIII